jgi:hypothetical protein
MSEGQMKDFRSLSLMNTDYKIVLKVLSTRLRKVIGIVIQQDQIDAILGRSIQDNVLSTRTVVKHQLRGRRKDIRYR